MVIDWKTLWDELNERQQAYLVALYNKDQEAEWRARGAWRRGERSQPADKWRWIEYGPVGASRLINYHPPLRYELRQRDLVDQGSGATWEALEQRGLVERRSDLDFAGHWAFHILYVKLTRRGRKLARDFGRK